MIIPMRCMGCGKPISHLFEQYKEKISNNEDTKKILDELDLKRYCCRSTMLSHVDLIDLVVKFKKS